ncbi:MAG TPA: hypothetical protein VG267_16720 [Terracidiphilus sp.]|jgi:plasmid stability protein|nr:hypothetical protein [Terracidiphilus sp.]
MATITIRNIDEDTKRKLQVRAALNGRSMEAEAREALRALANEEWTNLGQEGGLASAIHRRFAKLGGVELEIPERGHVSRSDEGSDLTRESKPSGLGTAIHELFAPLGGVELPIPPRRKSHRTIPTFE